MHGKRPPCRWLPTPGRSEHQRDHHPAPHLPQTGDRVLRPRLLRRAGVPRPSLRGRRAVGSGPISLGPRPRSVESRPDPSAPTPLRGSGVHSQVVAHPVIGCADGSCRLHSRSRLTNPSSRNRNATSNSALLGGDHAGVLQVGVRAFRGPFAAVSTPQFPRTF